MSSSHKGLRGTVVVEDVRTREFVRRLLRGQGFPVRRFEFEVAPRGRGAASAWVLARYPNKVRWLRTKRDQKGLRLVMHCDGDNLGTPARKEMLNDKLETEGLDPRLDAEKIALLIPTWSTETWLLGLLGEEHVEENESLKIRFERRSSERDDLQAAAAAWDAAVGADLCSLNDARDELRRIAP